jgi:hypothetical protein
MKRLASVFVIAAAAMLAPVASATTILTFGQAGGGSPIVGTNNGAGSTTISGGNVAITITQIDALLATPIAAFLNFTVTSIGPAIPVAGFVFQEFSGGFTITSGLGGTGINYLSATFVDFVFGAGSSLTLSAANPPGTTSFTSSVITDLGIPNGIALSFANVNPSIGISHGSLRSFTSSVSGTFSGTQPSREAPEPGTLALVGLAMLGLAGSLRRRSNR